MKIGPQGEESLPEIIERKNREAKIFDHAYWGYGGVTCVPFRVHGFAKEVSASGSSIKVLFAVTGSPFLGSHIPDAKENSEDNVLWRPIPSEIHITVSKYALVLKNLKESDFNLALNDYQVAVGPSRGKSLASYLRFRVDKALAQRTGSLSEVGPELKISFTADLVEPYALYLKH